MSSEKKKHEYPPPPTAGAWRSIDWARASRSDSQTQPSPLRTSMQTSEGEEEVEEEMGGGDVITHWTREGRRGSTDVGNDSNARRRSHALSILAMGGDDGGDEGNGLIRSRSHSRTPTQEDSPTITHWSRERVRTPPRELDTSSSRGTREKLCTPPREPETLIHRGRESITRPLTPVRQLSLDQINPENAELSSHITRSSAVVTRSRSPSFDGYEMMRKRVPLGDDEGAVGSKSARGRRSSVDSSVVRQSADANSLLRTESDTGRWQKDRHPLSRESSLTALFSIPPNSNIPTSSKPSFKGIPRSLSPHSPFLSSLLSSHTSIHPSSNIVINILNSKSL
jgi:hypothetical protein